MGVFAIGVVALILTTKIFSGLWTHLTGLVGRPVSTVISLVNPSSVIRSTDGRTNILVLGKGGAMHEAPDLTDSIMVISLRLTDHTVTVISIPRDIWIPSMKAKINTAYYYGEQKEPGGGLVLAKDAVFQVTDLPIHYTALVDFEGFREAIDLVGGIEVDVQRSFVDEKYPVENRSGTKPEITAPNGETPPVYETIRFEQGIQVMDGDTALKFTRSRNSTDPEEGTDFSRSRRQQQVLVALAKKLKQKETILNLDRIRELRRVFSQYVETDLRDDELLALGRIGLGVEIGNIQHLTLDTGSDEQPGLLVNPPTSKYGQWVLEPRGGNWSQVHDVLREKLGQQ